MSFKVTDKNGNLVFPGMIIKDFRGEEHIFKAVERGPLPGKSAKVRTDRGTYYCTVWDLTVTEIK